MQQLKLEIDLLAVALRELATDYEELNWALFKSQLRPAPLSIVEHSSRLGCWHSDPRRIELSKSLVLEQPWGVVIEVLKHEMAHQFVEEVLQVRDETAHGPAFLRICARLGIDSRASDLPSVDGTTRVAPHAAILERIAKLLALAQSPNPHEAEAAMRTAHRLMLKHNVEQASAQTSSSGYGFRHLGKPTGRATEAEVVLAGLLGEFFFVQPIWVSVFRIQDEKRVRVLEVTGRYENLAMADYVYNYLMHAADALWRAHKRERGIKRDADRKAYLAGVMRGFADKLRAERNTQRGEGLIWVGDPESDKHFKRRHPRVRTSHSKSRSNSAAESHGREAGKNLTLHRPLAEPTRNRGRMLPC